jgi:2,3-bisphosphoglycerate-dependent phosphoglycerate mutase
LTDKGRVEASLGAKAIMHIKFDVAYTSALLRAQETLEIILRDIRQPYVPVIRDKALNERDYGDLCGLNKEETAKIHGEERVKQWRRSFDTAPPNGESLKMTAARTLPFFERAIMGDIRLNHNVLVCAHGNSNRSIVMSLDQLSPAQVVELELATGVPRIYEYKDPLGRPELVR